MDSKKHVFTTEGGITNNTWEGEGGTPVVLDRLARPMDPEDFLVEIPMPDVDCKFTVDIDPDYQGWPVWQNPINVIDKVIYEQLGSFMFEEVVSLPTICQCKKHKHKPYGNTVLNLDIGPLPTVCGAVCNAEKAKRRRSY